MSGSAGVEIVRVAHAGDSALVVDYPPRIDPRINDRAAALARTLRRRWAAIVRDVVVGYRTVTVYFDPLGVDSRWLEDEIRAIDRETAAAPGAGRAIEVPVCYEGELAPDLAEVAAFAACSPEDVIGMHLARVYRVYVIGFVPGFAYLAEVDPRIARPRRPTPRVAVPAGSVAIAGPQTGIYPSSTPGGWNIIGRTPVRPFDPARPEPCLFRPGDTVRFVRITRDEFDREI